MRRLLAFLILAFVKTLTHVFYRGQYRWPPGQSIRKFFPKVRLLVFLNHTSLYEVLFMNALPYRFLWRISGHTALPGADATLDRPIVGLFWKLLIPRITTITRKRDETWAMFLESIRPTDMVFIAPEGRMKRPGGLDKDGQKMTVRGGVADVIEKIPDGLMLICLSGGLHHVQVPGVFLPKIFRTIRMNFQLVDIAEFKAGLSVNAPDRKIEIIRDLQRRLEHDCPAEVLGSTTR